MAEPYLGEIRCFAFDYAPQGWALCNGQLLSVSQYQALYALLGTQYGGDGTSTFGLPDLCGRAPLHASPQYPCGTKWGVEGVGLTGEYVPSHTHQLMASSAPATTNDPTGNVLAAATIYTDAVNPKTLVAGALSTNGTAHSNMQPSLVVSFCIALSGVYPPRN